MSVDAVSATLGADGGGQTFFTFVEAVREFNLVALVPLLAAAGALVNLVLLLTNRAMGKSRGPAYMVFGLLAAGFVCTLVGYMGWRGGDQSPVVTTLFQWFDISWTTAGGEVVNFVADFGFYMDGLSWLWMLFVTGLASMICLYASEYMDGDRGYARFFAAFSLFVASMACLVMGDNLVMLYLGWEGVGLCSYMLIGYFYKRPAAVAAAKKAFIVNRIGDLGLALGLYLIWTTFGTVEYDRLFELVSQGIDGEGNPMAGTWQAVWIPALLMIGAFGKSAQLPLYVWLPDAMEGPTPVSALIHAATMVTAGVYLVARMFPLFLLDDGLIALQVVMWVGTLTALVAATIGMAQFDIKRIMAYSTVSQLGYMFAGVGFMTTTGAAFHVFTHAFFKATLFLACGAVMHGFAGQLDLRKLSGLMSMKGWMVVSLAMLVGCLNLAGVPFTAGYFSKDMILAEAFTTPDTLVPMSSVMGWLLLLTAGLTAYYTFRVFFRVFVGPASYEPGDELHGHGDDDHGHGDGHADDHNHGHGDHGDGGFHPHAPGWAINTVLAVLAVGSIVAAGAYFVDTDGDKKTKGWVGDMVGASSAYYASGAHHVKDTHGGAGAHGDAAVSVVVDAQPVVLPVADGAKTAGSDMGGAVLGGVGVEREGGSIFGGDPHKLMYYVSAVVGLIGILVAAFLHGPKGLAGLGIGSRTDASRSRADGLIPYMGPVPRWAQHKWYVDEFYNMVIRVPLLVASHLMHWIDKLLIDGALVDGVGGLPRAIGRGIRPSQGGVLQGYALGMVGGVGALLLIVWLVAGAVS